MKRLYIFAWLLLAGSACAQTWDDAGCLADDPTFDNGPLLSKMLSDQGDTILVPPVGTMRAYYISTPIIWPRRSGGALLGSGGYGHAMADGQYRGHKQGGGVTRLIWNGEPGEPMIVYQGAGGRIENLMLQGQPLEKYNSPLDQCAGAGIRIPALSKPSAGNLTTRNVAFIAMDKGIETVNEPSGNHADQLSHYSPLFHRVRIPYSTDCNQSVIHSIYDMDVRGGYETVFDFKRGGKLNVFGIYLGDSINRTVLSIGKATCNNNDFVIRGLEIDGSVVGMRLVEHGQYVGRVRIDGHVPCGATLADPFVLARPDEKPSNNADIVIDMNGAKWPVEN